MGIEKIKTVNFRGNKLNVNFPNVGQMIDMESLKLSYTNNKYAAMAHSSIRSMNYALDLVDAFVFISICVPQIKVITGQEDFLKIDVLLGKELIDFYKEEILPWYSELLRDLYSISLPDKKEEEEKTDSNEPAE